MNHTIARTSAAWLLLGIGLFGASGTLHAQTAETLVSNIRTATTTTSSIVGQPFTTGANSDGYTLSGVEISFDSNRGSNGSATTDVLVRIVPNAADGTPDTSAPSKFITLTTSATARHSSINTYTAPAGAMLSANTTYHVLVTNAAGTNTLGSLRARTTANGAETTAAAGWSIGNTRYFKTDPNATSWRTSVGVLQIAVKGHANRPADAATGAPGFDGYPQVGEELTATIGNIADTDGLPATAFPTGYTFQWVRVVSGADTDIASATSHTYTPAAADLGHTLKVKVSFTDGADNGEGPLTSAATDTVAAARAACDTGNLWCATLTMGESTTADEDGDRPRGYCGPGAGTLTCGYGALSDDDFDIDRVTYTVESVRWGHRSSSNLNLTLDRDFAATAGLTLKVESHEYDIRKAYASGNTDAPVPNNYSFSTGARNLVDYAVGQKVTVQLVQQDNTAATGTPTISGTAQEGETLTANAGTGANAIADSDGLPDGPFPTGYTFQWVRFDADGTTGRTEIPGATNQTYELAAADADKKIKVEVSFTDDLGYKETRTSAAHPDAGTVLSSCPAPDFGARRHFWTGTVTVGESFFGNNAVAARGFKTTSSLGALTPTTFSIGANTYTIDEYSNGPTGFKLPIFSLTSSLLTATERAALRLNDCAEAFDFSDQVSGYPHQPTHSYSWSSTTEWEGGTTRTAYLSLSANNAATGKPTISGTAQVGETLTAGVGDIADSDGLPTTTFPAGYSFQWVRVDSGNETDIAGATSHTYDLTDDDLGKTVKVKVSFKDPLYVASYTQSGTDVTSAPPETRTSDASDKVTSKPGAPQTFTATAGNKQVTLAWTAPASAGEAAITKYQYRYSTGATVDTKQSTATWTDIPDGTGDIDTDAGNETGFVVPSLTNGTEYAFELRAVNAVGESEKAGPETATPAAPRTAPSVANEIPGLLATVGESFSYTFAANTFADVNGDTLTYTATKGDNTDLPAWLTFNSATRSFSGRPTAAQVGVHAVKVTASDGMDGSTNDTFHIVVSTAPVLVSNIGQAVRESAVEVLSATGSSFAQPFTTGGHAGGYRLAEIVMEAERFGINTDPPTVSIYSAAGVSGSPDTSLYTLTNPTSLTFDDDLTVFTAPANALLKRNTTYLVVFEAGSSGSYDLGATDSNSEDTGAAANWSIADGGRSKALDILPWSSSAIKLRIGVRGSNNAAPTSSDGEVTTDEDVDYTFKASDFSFSDTDTGDALAGVKIVTLPDSGKGTLKLDGTAIAAAELPKAVTRAELDGNKLVYEPSGDASGDNYTSFEFKVSDGGGDSTSSYTMTIDVDPVPDITDVAVTSTPTSGTAIPKDTYGESEKIQVTVTFDEAVDLEGAPTLAVMVGTNTRTAAYESGTGTTRLVFAYTVVSGDTDSDGVSIAADALTLEPNDKIENSDDNAAVLTFAAKGNQAAHKVDGSLTPPSVCPAPDFGTRRHFWTGTLTVGESFFGNNVVADRGFKTTSSLGALTLTTFSIGANTYTIDEYSNGPTGFRLPIFSLTSSLLTATERAALRLNDCAEAFDFSDQVSGYPHQPTHSYSWSSTTEWEGGTTRTAYLSLPANNAATGKPTISGTAQVGETLTADAGDIADTDGLPATTFPAGYTFQWVRVVSGVETDISGETARTYELTRDDLGKTVKVKVSFKDQLYVASYTANNVTVTDAPPETRTSDASGTVAAAGAPEITGVAQVGETLTAGKGDMADVDGLPATTFPAGYTFQWVRVVSGVETDISGETARTYTLTDADAGNTVKVKVSFTDGANNNETRTSAAHPGAGTVLAACAAPDFGTRRHFWTGTMTVAETTRGNIVTARGFIAADSLGALTPTTFSIGANTYTINKYSNLPGSSRAGFGPIFSLTGSLLTAGERAALRLNDCVESLDFSTQAAGFPSAVDYSYSWSSATEWEAGKTRTLYLSLPANNAATGKPAISGTAQVNGTLIAGAGDIADTDGLPATTFPTGYSFQWVRVDGGNETDIAGATRQTYTLTDDDLGKTIKVKVSFKDPLYVASYTQSGTDVTGAPPETRTSDASDTVTAAPTDRLNTLGGETLVSNIRTATTVSSSMMGQPFTTGANSDDYTLTGVEISFDSNTSGHGSSTTNVLVRIVPSAGDGTPDTSDPSKFITLTTPVTARHSSINTYTAPAGAMLSANTTYHVLVTNAAGTNTLGNLRARTTGNAAETTAAAGWSVGNTRYFKTDPNASSWRKSAGVLQIAVKGHANISPGAATGAPGFDGYPQVGEALTATVGNIGDTDGLPAGAFPTGYTFQWVRVVLGVDTDIASATSRTYTPAAADLGHTLKVKVSFTDGAGNSEGPLTSAVTDTVVAARAACDTGNLWCATLTMGESTTADEDGDRHRGYCGPGAGTALCNYGALSDDDFDIDSVTYTVESVRWGHRSSSNLNLTLDRDFAATAGLTLKVESHEYDIRKTRRAPAGVQNNYRWGTSSASKLIGYAAGQKVTVQLVREDNTAATGTPTISGTAQEGETLTANAGTGANAIADTDGLPDGPFPTGYTFQWLRFDADGASGRTEIPGATGRTYELTAADADKKIKVEVSFTDGLGYSETRISAAHPDAGTVLSVCPAPDFGTRRHFWTGTLTVGESFFGNNVVAERGFKTTSSLGALTPTTFNIGANTYTIDEYSNGPTSFKLPVFSLTSSLLTATERAALRLNDCAEAFDFSDQVSGYPHQPTHSYSWSSATDWEAGTTRTAYLSLPANNAATGKPTISGTAQVGETLTANAGDIADTDGLPATTFPAGYSFQWVRVDGRNETDIAGATARTYKLTDDDLGKTVKVKVSFKDQLYVASYTASNVTVTDAPVETRTSDASDTVTAARADPQRLTGNAQTLVSNIRTATTVSSSMMGQPFTTGANSDGYTLSGVEISFDSNTSGHGSSTTDVLVRIVPSAGDGTPDTSDSSKFITLTTSATARHSSINTYAAPVGAMLSANTTYHVFVTNAAGTNTLGNLRARTTGNAAETTAAAGWSIGDTRYFKTDPNAASWRTSVGVLQITVKGHANTSANAAPTASNGEVTTDEDVDYIFKAADFNFSDTDNGDALKSVKVESLPDSGKGTLKLDGTAIVAANLPKAVTKAELDDNKLVYDPPGDANGDNYASFTFKVNDGDDDSTSTYTLTIDVDSVPDVTDVAVTSTPTSGSANPKDTYGLGEKIQVTVTFDEAVTVNSDPTLNVTVGVNERFAAYTSGTGTTALIFEYTVFATDTDTDGISIAADAIILDADDKIENSDDQAADLTFSAKGKQAMHKVNGGLTPSTAATGAPAIEGFAQVGQSLTAAKGSIDDDNGLPAGTFPAGYTFQWVRDVGGVETDIAMATGSTYTLVAADLGNTLKVKVSFNDADSNSEGPLSSAATDTVVAAPAACDNGNLWCATLTVGESGMPRGYCSGNVRNTCGYGALDDDDFMLDGVTYDVKSLRWGNGLDKSLHLTLDKGLAATGGLTLKVESHELDLWESEQSNLLDELGDLPANDYYWGRPATYAVGQKITVQLSRENNTAATGTPTISGTARVGETLTANEGASPNAFADTDGLPDGPFPADYTFQWVRFDTDGTTNRTVITDATSRTYVLATADAGKTVKVEVSFTDDLGYSETRVSDATDTVTGAPSAPQNFTATAGDTQVTLAWTAPASQGGGPVTKYQYRHAEGTTVPSTTTWNDVPDGSDAGNSAADETGFIVTTLDNSTEYAFEVRAVNSFGGGEGAGPETATPVSSDTTAPTVASIVRQTPSSSPTNANTLVWRVAFSEAVENVNAADFSVEGTTANLTVAEVSTTVYDVTLNGGNLADLNATVTLSFANGQNIEDANGNDLANTTPTGTDDDSYVVDNTAPRVASIVRQTPSSSPTNANTLVWRVTFSEAVENVNDADFELDGSTANLAAASVSNSTTVYDVTASSGNLAGLNGTVTLDFASGQNIEDAAGNDLTNTTPTGTNNDSYVVDNTAPRVASIVRQTPSSSPTNANTLVWRVTFNEAVENVNDADFELNGSTANLAAASVSNSTTVYDVTASSGNLASLNATVTLSFASNQDIEDAAGNDLANTTPTGTDYDSYVVDNTAPRVASIVRQTPSSSPTNANTLVWRVTFSEAVENVNDADFELNGSTANLAAASVSSSTTVYDVTASSGNLANLNATVTLNFASGQNIEDAAGNDLTNTTPTGTDDDTYVVDNTAPTVTIGDVPSTSTAAFTAKFTFSESVSGFALADIAVGNGTASSLTKDTTTTTANTVYTALITPTASGAVTVDVNANVATDAADNGNTAAVRVSSTYTAPLVDTTAPRVASIVRQTPSSSPTNANTLVWRVTFNEAVENVNAADFELNGSTANLAAAPVSNSTTVYDVTASSGNLANLNGTVTLSFASGQNIEDAAGNDLANTTPTGTNNSSYVLDNTAPRVASIVRQTPSSSPTNANTLVWRVTFNEAVENVNGADFELNGSTANLAAASVSNSTTVYDVTASSGNLADLNATVTLSFASGQNIEDAAGNSLATTTPTGTNNNTYVVDNTAPTVTIGDVPAASTAAFTAKFTFSETVTGFAATDIRVGNGTASNFTVDDTTTAEDTVFTALITPTASGAVTVDVNANVATDAADNGNTAAARVSSTYTAPVVDTTAPRVASIVRQTPSSSPTNANTLVWRVAFSEAVENVTAADFELDGSTANLTVAEVSNTVYDVTASSGNLASLNGTVTLDFASGQNIEDAAGNDLANTTPTGTNNDSYVLDNTAPRVTSIERQTPSSSPTNANTLVWRVTFSEAVENVNDADFELNGSTANLAAASVSNSTTVYDVTASSGNLADLNATVTLSFASGQNIEDAAGNDLANTTPTGTDDDSYVVDNTAPRVASIVRQTPSSSPTNANTLVWRVTFSEAVENVNDADFELNGSTANLAAASVSSSTTVYDVTASSGNLANLNATVTLNFASGQNIEDAAGNDLTNTTPTGTNNNTYVVDNTAPTVTIGDVPAASTAAFTAKFTFSETVTGFAATDIRVGNGTASNFTVDDTTTPANTVFTALITPTASGAVTVDVNANVATDAADNGNTAAVRVSSTYTAPLVDTTAPRVASIVRQTPSSSPTNANTLVWRVTFNEAVENVNDADFELSGSTANLAAASVSNSTTVYDVTASSGNLASLNGTVTLNFASGQNIEDAAGNDLTNTTPTGTNNDSYVVDNTAPTVTIGDVPSTSIAAFTAKFTFSESVSGFALADIGVGNGTASNFTVDDTTAVDDTVFTALITPTANGAVTVDVNANVATDAADNGNTAATRVSSTYTAPVVDNTAPRVASIVRQTPSSSPTNANTLVWRVTFSEAVENVNAADFELDGSTANLTVAEVSTTVYDVTLNSGNLASLNATVTLSFASNQNIEDANGNDLTNTTPTGTDDDTYVVDNTAPTVTIGDVPSTSTAAFTAKFTFSESVTGFVLADIGVGNGTASNFKVDDTTAVDDSVYTALITPTASGAVTVDVNANVATDAADNGNTAATRVSSTYTAPVVDNTAPRVASIVRQTPSSSPTNANTLVWRVTFSEAVENVNAADFELDGSTANLTVAEVSNTVYDVTASSGNLASLNATVTLHFASGQNIEDAAGNDLANTTPTGTNNSSYVVDNTAPTVTIGDVPSTSTAAFTAKFTFSESVTGFALADIAVGNGTASSLTKDTTTTVPDSVYTALITPTASGAVNVDVNANVATDAADNGNTAAVRVSSTYTAPLVDTTAPRVASIVRQTPSSSPTNANTLVWRVTFSEAVENVNAADFELDGSTANLTVAEESTTVYDVTLNGGNLAGLNATVTLSFASGQNIEDSAGNDLTNAAPTGTNDDTYVVDNTAPTVTIGDVPSTSTAAFTAKFTFSESVTGFAVGDIGVGNGTASNFTVDDTTTPANTVYTALITPTASGAVTVDVNANVATDAADNGNAAAARVSSTYTAPLVEYTAPRVDIPIPDRIWTAGTALNFAFSEYTFADEDGDTLSYTARRDNDTALPAWLRFNAATRTFSGTPRVADVGALGVKVTASDGTGSVDDIFNIIVSEAVAGALVSNLGQPANASFEGGVDLAQEFTTGSNPDGYELSSVEIVMLDRGSKDLTSSSYDPLGDPSVSVCSLDGGDPGTDCTALIAPASFAVGVRTFTAPSGTVLAANTTYALVITASDGESLTFSGTTSRGEDSGAAQGWSIADRHKGSGGSTWRSGRWSVPLRIALAGKALSVARSPVEDGEDEKDDDDDAGAKDDDDARAEDDAGGKDNDVDTAPDPGPANVSVADARVREGPGAELEFVVTLSNGDNATVVWYETANGTATAGEDYTAASGSLFFPSGVTSKTISITVLDDAHDEGHETMTLRLTEVTDEARIVDGEATGTIENSDPLPAAWIGRLGRAAADNVIEAVGRRWERAGQAPAETHFTLNGRRLDTFFGRGPDAGPQGGATPSHTGNGTALPNPGIFSAGQPGTGQPGAGQPGSGHIATVRPGAGSIGAVQPGAGMSGGGAATSSPGLGGGVLAGGNAAGGGFGGVPAAGGYPMGGSGFGEFLGTLAYAAGDAQWAQWLRQANGLAHGPRIRLRDALMNSSFYYSPHAAVDAGEGGGRADSSWLGDWAAWGETSSTHFGGAEEALSLTGDVGTALIGFDSRRGRWLTGVALSYTDAHGSFSHPTLAGGALESKLTTLSPYAHFELSDRSQLWGVAGYGSGDLTLTPTNTETAIETGLANTFVAVGGRTALSVAVREAGRLELALRTDARFTQTTSGAAVNLMGAAQETSRVRAVLEGQGVFPLPVGGALMPTLEAGLRYDGGDAETGAGVEMAVGLGYAVGRLTVQINARGLLAHQDAAYEEWGYSAMVGYRPGEDGLGLSMNIGAVRGAAQSGVQTLWSAADAAGLARGGAAMPAAQYLRTELGYGFEGRNGQWLPYVGIDSGNGQRAIRLGLRLTSGQKLQAGLELNQSTSAVAGASGGGQSQGDLGATLTARMLW